MSQLEQFGETMAKIMNCYKTGIEFNFTKNDALAIMNAGQTVMKAGQTKPDFPDFIDDETTGENLPENFPVNLPQPVLMEQPVIAKPIVTYLKAKTLELLAENVNQFNKSESIRILYAAPFQQVGNEFVKEIVYYDFES